MRVLIVKLTSMGDLVQALPAISEAKKNFPDIQFDWVVDESFAEIPHWHPAVNKVICSAHRRWKKGLFSKSVWQDLRRFWRELRDVRYDYVIDAQTNIKSAVVTRLALGPKHGPDRQSVREFGAHWAYQQQYSIAKPQLAIERWRQLFAKVLAYELSPSVANIDFGLENSQFPLPSLNYAQPPVSDYKQRYVVFVQNASWPSKCWSQDRWQALVDLANQQSLAVFIPWGNQTEKEAAELIAEGRENCVVLPRLSLSELAAILQHAAAAVCMDTGLAHISAALATPTLTLYGPTDPALIGATGSNSLHIIADSFSCAPCYKRDCQHGGTRNLHAQCLQSMSADQCWLAIEKILR